jgi:hypothetical protein
VINIDKQVQCQPTISETSDAFHPGKWMIIS